MGRRENKRNAEGKKRNREDNGVDATGDQVQDRSQQNNGKWVDMRDPNTYKNAALERFYRHQLHSALGTDEQWEQFHSALKARLPSGLRLNIAQPAETQAFVKKQLLEQFADCGTQVLEWVEGGSAFQVPLSRGEIKRSRQNKRVKKLSAALNDAGFLSRQEAVSMIPALFLDVQPGNVVADLCAAPGSKTTQILEHLVKGGDTINDGGCVVANDVNAGRLDILNHQTGRLPGAQSRLLITRHDAIRFPLHKDKLYDRVLCDVMCSGDGTFRKSMDLWGRWSANDGLALHNSQSQVLIRGMSIVKEGGIVVYSTCSMNPIEDEAVIYRCLEQAKGCFELIDCSSLLPELKREQGIYSWSVMSRDGTECYKSVEEAKQKSARFQRYTESMWPPTEDEAKAAHLERCCRLLPHAQDTGGFFIAALRCVKDYRTTANVNKTDPNATNAMKPLTEETKNSIANIFQLKPEDNFPFDQILSRGESTNHPKFYYCSKKGIEMMNTLQGAFNVEQAGEKVFEYSTKRVLESIRFVSEGVSLLSQLLPSRYMRKISFEKIKTFMTEERDGHVTFGIFQESLAAGEDQGVPPPQFVAQVDVPGYGRFDFASSSSDGGQTVKVRITDQQRILIKSSLGEEILPPEATTTIDDLEDEGEADEKKDE